MKYIKCQAATRILSNFLYYYIGTNQVDIKHPFAQIEVHNIFSVGQAQRNNPNIHIKMILKCKKKTKKKLSIHRKWSSFKIRLRRKNNGEGGKKEEYEEGGQSAKGVN